MNAVSISGTGIGQSFSPYIVAELSANHGGSLDQALKVMDAAAAAGADAIKLQTYTPDTLTIDHHGPGFQIASGLWKGRSLYELYAEAHTPWEWHSALFARGRELGVSVFSSPFDDSAVDFLERLQAPAYKIASFEMVDLQLIRRVAKTGKPVVMSTGMASVEEIEEAVDAFREAQGTELILLHCVSGYPTPIGQSNLRRIPILRDRFECAIGLSDHTPGIDVSVAAVALGACFIEKHFTLSRADGGPDASFSLEPGEFAALCSAARNAFAALGDGQEARSAVEDGSMAFRRSLYVVKDVQVGETLTTDNVRSIRPGYGLAPKHLPALIGRRAKQLIVRGTPLDWRLID